MGPQEGSEIKLAKKIAQLLKQAALKTPSVIIFSSLSQKIFFIN